MSKKFSFSSLSHVIISGKIEILYHFQEHIYYVYCLRKKITILHFR